MTSVSLWIKSFCVVGALTGIAAAAEVVVESPSACTRKTGFVISEIMYKPVDDGLANTEFIEIYNSNPFEENLTGYRISGEIDFDFPDGTILAGQSYLVLAKNVADFQARYALSGTTVLEYGDADGGNSLARSGTLRMRNNANGIILEID
jgi:hypothetical protein